MKSFTATVQQSANIGQDFQGLERSSMLYIPGKPCVLDDVIKWKHFPPNWPFVRGIRRLPVNSPHQGQWRGAFMFSLTCAWINGWVNKGKAGYLRRNRAYYNVIVILRDILYTLLPIDK